MKISEVITEGFEIVKIAGLIRNLTSDEMKLYKKIKKSRKLFKKELDEYEQRIANNMVNKGLIHRKRSNNEKTKGELYFTTIGRASNIQTKELDEVAPPSKESEKWIKKNKKKFKEKYGDDYEKYLYGHAWNMFNGKKSIKEGYVKRKRELGNTGIMFDDDYIDFEPGMAFIDDNERKWIIDSVNNNICKIHSDDGLRAHIDADILNSQIFDFDKYHMIYDSKFFSKNDSIEKNEL